MCCKIIREQFPFRRLENLSRREIGTLCVDEPCTWMRMLFRYFGIFGDLGDVGERDDFFVDLNIEERCY